MPYGPELWTESVSNVTATNSVELGSRRSEGGKEYVYVYNAGASASVGYGCTISGVTGYSVTVSSLTGASPLAGVVVHSTFTTAAYGWLCVKGFCSLENDATTSVGTGTNEKGMMLSDDGTFARVTSITGATCLQAAFGGGGGFNLVSTAAGASSLAHIHGIL